jgi:hypothetical protein
MSRKLILAQAPTPPRIVKKPPSAALERISEERPAAHVNAAVKAATLTAAAAQATISFGDLSEYHTNHPRNAAIAKTDSAAMPTRSFTVLPWENVYLDARIGERRPLH